MKNIKIILVTLIFSISVNGLKAQTFGAKIERAWYKTMATLRPTPWVIGLGWNIVDDDGNPFHKIVNGKSLNAYPFINTFRLEKYIDKGWSATFNFSYNNYVVGKLINSDIPSTSSSNFMSFDLNAKYDFCALYNINEKWFNTEKNVLDLYSTFGFGYTVRNISRVNNVGTLNIGFGTNIWIYNNWGLNLQSSAKFGLKAPFLTTPSNYLQHCFGVIHLFKTRKGSKSNHSIKGIF